MNGIFRKAIGIALTAAAAILCAVIDEFLKEDHE
jgi:hypothetical protein